MRFSPAFLDELKSRLRVSDIVGRRVKLQKRGREYVGLSPFKSEKTPSFTVNDDKGFYHCFSSGEHGDVISFLMEVEGLSFNEAIEKLAGEAGMELPKPDRFDQAKEEKRKSLYDVVQAAADWFAAQLRSSPAAENARDYLLRRGLDAAAVGAFHLGFAPGERAALKTALIKLGFEEKMLVDAGLVIQPDDGRPSYDRFRNRIIFPITDARGRFIAFGGRALDADAPAKYLNSPETPLFHKGSVLFNYPRARDAARNFAPVIVVEGYMDVIALHQAGFEGAVAPLGTAMTEAQLGLLWRVTAEPVLAFDGDEAGSRAAMRVVDRALPILKPGKSVRFSFLPNGLDPDDFIRERGAAAFRDLLNRSQGLADLLWQKEIIGRRLSTPEQKAALAQQFETAIAQIEDKVVRDYYRFDFKVRLSEFFWRTARRKENAAQPVTAAAGTDELDDLNYERMVLGLLVEYPDLGNAHIETIEPDWFSNDWHAEFCNALHTIYLAGEVADVLDIYEQLPPRFYMLLNQVHGEERGGDAPAARRARGHRLHARFPMVMQRPPHAVIERCFLHFMKGLHIRTLEKEKNQTLMQAGDFLMQPDKQAEAEKLYAHATGLERLLMDERKKYADEEITILYLIEEFSPHSNGRQLSS